MGAAEPVRVHHDVTRPTGDRLRAYPFGGAHHIVADGEFALQELDTMPHVPRHAPRGRVYRCPPMGSAGGFGAEA